MNESGNNIDGENSLAPGSAYLDYCVKQGWLIKNGEGECAIYMMTPEGEKKLSKASLNFDLSKIEKIDKESPRKYKRRK